MGFSFDRLLAPDVRIQAEGEGRPLERYAVTLQVRIEGRWRTVRLLDNAHGEHEMHRYTGTEKQAAERFAHGSVREVAPQAIDYLESNWEEIARAWRS
jgi:hypothetical protein